MQYTVAAIHCAHGTAKDAAIVEASGALRLLLFTGILHRRRPEHDRRRIDPNINYHINRPRSADVLGPGLSCQIDDLDATLSHHLLLLPQVLSGV